ncbi:MAG: efflux RND transporter permease subunit [Odoribacteraceae bacterium]|jgi:Cu(I)/Ag(I) efflux system membrane protein CusA/SilA|nr:efflux RND transporter permease subunit [Odoribacteraceae bacterium]
MLDKTINYFLDNRLVAVLLLAIIAAWGLSASPFNRVPGILPRDPVPVDAIPDIGENQQIVATEWMGRSPVDVQDQVTYPLSASLLGVPGVKTIRGTSMFGMSFIHVIFEDDIEFYWSRARVLEKLASLPPGTLPAGVQPTLGPDATALGQVFWYTLEGRSPDGTPAGGWDAGELRALQDFHVKPALAAAGGVAEVASIGGFVKEYQVEVDPGQLEARGLSLMDAMAAARGSNLDVSAGTVEINRVEYLARGVGYIKSARDLEESVVSARDGAPVLLRDVAFITEGPAPRRGGLDKEGAEAVGGVVVARHGSNPLEVIDNVKRKIEEIAAGMPSRVLDDGTVSRVAIVPFYDRSGLIRETIGTLETALSHEILICIIVVLVMVFHLRASLIISSILPVAVLSTFIIMRYSGVDANVVALSGIAIAIGVMVDVGVVVVESILRHRQERAGEPLAETIRAGVKEVGGALATGMLTTVISFLPVFAMQAREGKLFHPLAFTKTFALLSAFLLGFAILPTIAYYILSFNIRARAVRLLGNGALVAGGAVLFLLSGDAGAWAITALGVNNLLSWRGRGRVSTGIALLTALYYLTRAWLPVGSAAGLWLNFCFVVACAGSILGILWALVAYYERLLRWCLSHRWKFMTIPAFALLLGATIWLGFDRVFGIVATGAGALGLDIRGTVAWQSVARRFPGMGEEFMPSLDEGSFLLMPSSMPHTGVEQNLLLIGELDRRVAAIPEVELTVGKWGRVASALDPAPVQMFENTVNYRPEYILDSDGRRQRFRVDDGAFLLADGSTYDAARDGFRLVPVDSLIADRGGEYFRQWRPEIKRVDDIWQEIARVTRLPGLTSSPRLQPIEARLVMLSTGMRAPMGIKVTGPDLESIEQGGKAIEAALKEVPGVIPATVFYDRAIGAPSIEIRLDRPVMARHGLRVADAQEIIETAIGGMTLATTVEGRERHAVRVRYPREERDNPEALARVLVPTPSGARVPLGEIAEIAYARAAQMIQSENTFLVGYVIFDKEEGVAEVEIARRVNDALREKTRSGALQLPAGVSGVLAGNHEQQLRASRRLQIVIPLSLLAIFLVLYFRFRSLTASLIHFSGVFVAFAGGFILLWLYGEPWFMDFTFGGMNARDIFQVHPVNLSIAVWVGFIALFGIATDDGVLMGSYIHDTFLARAPATRDEIREAVIVAGLKRVRPAAMTTATTLIALLPVLTSTGKGSDVMIPMAIPTFGGMLIQSMTMFVVPVLQCWWRERRVAGRTTLTSSEIAP